MAKNKAELQSDATSYYAALATMRKAHADNNILRAIKIAIAAREYIDGMMQFERRFEQRTDRKSVETFDYVFQYAPLTFDRASLEAIGEILKSQKRIEKNTMEDLSAKLNDARDLMWDAHRLWIHLEKADSVAQDRLRENLGGDQDRWRRIAESWDRMGLIQRAPERGSYRLSFVTQFTNDVRAKCRHCGVTAKAALARFLEEITCPKCKTHSTFVILPTSAQSVA